jgi:PAS domain S-box-containing protein
MQGHPTKSHEGIWTIDAQGNTLFASESMATLLRTTVADLLGKPSFDYVYEEDVPAARRLFESKSRGDISAFEFRLRRKDGTPVWVTVQGTPMHDAAGQFRGIIGTFRAVRKRSPEPNVKSREASADI